MTRFARGPDANKKKANEATSWAELNSSKKYKSDNRDKKDEKKWQQKPPHKKVKRENKFLDAKLSDDEDSSKSSKKVTAKKKCFGLDNVLNVVATEDSPSPFQNPFNAPIGFHVDESVSKMIEKESKLHEKKKSKLLEEKQSQLQEKKKAKAKKTSKEIKVSKKSKQGESSQKEKTSDINVKVKKSKNKSKFKNDDIDYEILEQPPVPPSKKRGELPPGVKSLADRLQEIKGTATTDVDKELEMQLAEYLKKDDRREKRRLNRIEQRQDTRVCFNCRKTGHPLSECPKVKKDLDQGTGICFKCGSTEHTVHQCNVRMPAGEYPFAKCFICGEMGHITKQCPDNPRGLYPNGGCCMMCGSVEHFKKDCPEFQKKQGISDLKLDTFDSKRSIEEDLTFSVEPAVKKKKKGPKIVKF